MKKRGCGWLGVVASGLGVLALGAASARADQCCWIVETSGWSYVSGRYTNADNGDAVVLATRPNGTLRPIMDALGEQHDHVVMVESYDGFYMSQSEGDDTKIQTASQIHHPIVGGLQPMYQTHGGWNYQTNADYAGQLRGYPTSTVLHGAAPNKSPYYGAGCGPTPSGYRLAGYSRDVTNGMCVQYMNDSCAMPRSAPRYYPPSVTQGAASAMYSAVFQRAQAGGQPWYAALFYGNDAFRHAANQVVNSFVWDNWWEEVAQNWSVPITSVVSPTQLAAGYQGAKEPVTYTGGYYEWRTWQAFLCDWGPDKGCGYGPGGYTPNYSRCKCGAGPFCPPGTSCANPL